MRERERERERAITIFVWDISGPNRRENSKFIENKMGRRRVKKREMKVEGRVLVKWEIMERKIGKRRVERLGGV